MPERQIPWRKAAAALGGGFQHATKLRETRYHIDAELEGHLLRIRGRSMPYSGHGNRTRMELIANTGLRGSIYIAKHRAGVAGWRRLIWHDVVLGDARFDHRWHVAASVEGHAQALLDREVRTKLDALPEPKVSSSTGDREQVDYLFRVRADRVIAELDAFDLSAESLVAHAHLLRDIAESDTRRFAAWQALARRLDGRLLGERFAIDGSMRVQVAVLGQSVVIAPMLVRTSLRRQRLRTRVLAECRGKGPRFRLQDEGGSFAPAALLALHELACADAQGDGRRVYAELDGDVCDAERLTHVSTAIATLAQTGAGASSPYR